MSRAQRNQLEDNTQVREETLTQWDTATTLFDKLREKYNALSDELEDSQKHAAELEEKVLKYRQTIRQLSSTRKTRKIPTPPMLTDGLDPPWEEWYRKIINKLEVNHDHYQNERAKVIYVLSCLGGKAFDSTLGRQAETSIDQFTTAVEVLRDLKKFCDREASNRRNHMTPLHLDEHQLEENERESVQPMLHPIGEENEGGAMRRMFNPIGEVNEQEALAVREIYRAMGEEHERKDVEETFYPIGLGRGVYWRGT